MKTETFKGKKMKPIRLAFKPVAGELVLNPGTPEQTTIKLSKMTKLHLLGLIEEGQNMWTDAQRKAVPGQSQP